MAPTAARALQYLTLLLAAPDAGVVLATLATLVAFVRKTQSASVRWAGSPELNARLMALAQGWADGDEALDLVACATPGEQQFPKASGAVAGADCTVGVSCASQSGGCHVPCRGWPQVRAHVRTLPSLSHAVADHCAL